MNSIFLIGKREDCAYHEKLLKTKKILAGCITEFEHLLSLLT